MPSGKVHSALTFATASGVIAPYLIVNLGGNPYLYLLGCAAGLLATPDLDVDKGNISDTYLRRMFPPAQWLWRTIWTPYSRLIPHRSPISHAPILGTVLRIGYIFLLINGFYILSHFLFDTVSRFYFVWDWSFVMGLCHVDTLHWFADVTIKGKEVLGDE